jgi:hypothetical protein
MKTTDRRNEIKYGMTRSKMADVLVVDKDVFRRFLRKIGIQHSYKLTPKEVEMIRRAWFGEYE